MEKHHAQDVCRTLGRVESQIIHLNRNVCDIATRIGSVDRRLLDLERQSYLWRGGLGVLLTLGALGGALMDYGVRWICKAG